MPVGAEIPERLFHAVAEVLAYCYRQNEEFRKKFDAMVIDNGWDEKIPVEDLKPGMRFSKAVYIDSNNILVESNQVIKEDDIKKLMKWGVSEIETTGPWSPRIRTSASRSALKAIHSNDISAIVNEFNSLLKKRRSMIEIHKRVCVELDKIYTAIKNNEKSDIKALETALDAVIKLMASLRTSFCSLREKTSMNFATDIIISKFNIVLLYSFAW